MKRRRLIVTSLAVALAASGLFVAYKVINAPAAGNVRPVTLKPVVSVTKDLQNYQGQYATYDYPVAFSEQSHPDIISPVIDRQWFSRGSLTGWQLSVTIYSLPSANETDNGDYNLRQTMPNRFSRTESTSKQGDTITIFSDTEAASFSKVAFVHSGSKLSAVALTGAASASNADLNEVLSGIVTSWRFND